MIGTYNYMLYKNDTEFVRQNWVGYLKAMDYIYGKVKTSGLLNSTGMQTSVVLRHILESH